MQTWAVFACRATVARPADLPTPGQTCDAPQYSPDCQGWGTYTIVLLVLIEWLVLRLAQRLDPGIARSRYGAAQYHRTAPYLCLTEHVPPGQSPMQNPMARAH
jgi:hypothetical protein